MDGLKKVVTFCIIAIAGLAGGVFLLRPVPSTATQQDIPPASSTNATSDKSIVHTNSSSPKIPTQPIASTHSVMVSSTSENSSKEAPDEFNPAELQPRAYYERRFGEMAYLPDGFELDGVILGASGIELDPNLEPDEQGIRQGTLVSPPEPFDFPSNAVAPLWEENLPDGTDLVMEVQVSPDGENWGAWQYLSIDNDSYGQMMQYYPDGSPNPNYGYTPGGLLAWGDRQFQSMRYRATLVSSNSSSPLLGAFRLHYQDSTMGEGHIASMDELAADYQTNTQTENESNEYVDFESNESEVVRVDNFEAP